MSHKPRSQGDRHAPSPRIWVLSPDRTSARTLADPPSPCAVNAGADPAQTVARLLSWPRPIQPIPIIMTFWLRLPDLPVLWAETRASPVSGGLRHARRVPQRRDKPRVREHGQRPHLRGPELGLLPHDDRRGAVAAGEAACLAPVAVDDHVVPPVLATLFSLATFLLATRHGRA